MKKLFLIAALAFSLNAMAQTDTANVDSMKMNHKMHKMMKDCVMMKDGKMVNMMNGQTLPMDKTMTMKDGTTVMPNGTVNTAGGNTVQLKDGDCVFMDGKIKKMHKKGNMM